MLHTARRKPYLAAAAVALAVAAGTLTGCGEPQNAQEMIEAYNKAVEETDNYNLSADMDVTMELGSMGMSFEVPIGMDFDFDIVGTDMHGTMDMNIDMSSLAMMYGLSADEAMLAQESMTAEMYVQTDGDEATTYSSIDGTNWTTTTETLDEDESSSTMLNEEVADIAEFETTDDEYKITVSIADMLEAEGFEDYLAELLGSMSGTEAAVLETLEMDGELVLYFEKGTNLLTTMSLDDVSASASDPASGVSVSYIFSGDVDVDKYGEIDKKDVEVPDDVLEAAGDSTSSLGTSGSLTWNEA